MLLRERTRLAQGWTSLSLAAQDAVISASETEAAVQPKTKYARLGGDRIAYQVLGQGPPDLVLAVGVTVDVAWEEPGAAFWLRNLASFASASTSRRSFVSVASAPMSPSRRSAASPSRPTPSRSRPA